MDKHTWGIVFLTLFIIIPLVNAASPFVSQSANGCEIVPILRDSLKINQDFTLSFHILNKTNGYPLSNSSVQCVLHLYNQTGDHSYYEIVKNDPASERLVSNDFVSRISGGNFSSIGTYSWMIQCNGTAAVGGCVDKGLFIVTNSGHIVSDGQGSITFSSILVLLFTCAFLVSIGFSFKGIAGKIIFFGIASMILTAAILYSLLSLTNMTGEFTSVIDGYETFLFVIKILISISIVFLIVFALIAAYSFWMTKRGLKES